jgi:multimeric flavodoxin WrbA
MNVLGLVGSPRKGGNTDSLVSEILRGCRASGHTTKKIYLYHHVIDSCCDCRRCKKGDFTCYIANDAMGLIYSRIEWADAIIFGTPLYWYGPTAKMKLLIDRLRPYVASRKLEGKKGVVVAPSEEGEEACGCLVEMFRKSFCYVGMEFAGTILPKAYERGDIKKNQEELRKAYDFGSSL